VNNLEALYVLNFKYVHNLEAFYGILTGILKLAVIIHANSSFTCDTTLFGFIFCHKYERGKAHDLVNYEVD